MTLNNRTLAVCGLLLSFSRVTFAQIGATEITKWQYGNGGHFSNLRRRQHQPISRGRSDHGSLRFPATFFIITSQIPSSQYQGAFIGRPTKTILEETAKTPTNEDNFFERASAIPYLSYSGTASFQTQAGEVYDEDRDLSKADQIIDFAHAKVRRAPSHLRQ